MITLVLRLSWLKDQSQPRLAVASGRRLGGQVGNGCSRHKRQPVSLDAGSGVSGGSSFCVDNRGPAFSEKRIMRTSGSK